MNFIKQTFLKPLSILFFILLLSCNSNRNSVKEESYNESLGFIKTELALEDLHFLFQRLEQVHYNPYLHISKDSIFKRMNFLKANWQKNDSIMKAEFMIETMKLLSMIEDGHTKMVWYSEEMLPKRDSENYFPIKFQMNGQKQVIINDPNFPQYQNEPVSFINGVDANLLYTEALKCLSSNFEHKNEIASNLFFPIFLYLKGISAPYSIELQSNHQIQIDSIKSVSFMKLFERLQPSKLDYDYELLENNIGLISYNSCNDYDAFQLFLDSTFEKIKQENVKDLIIDIRYNSGGNSALNDLLLNYITDKKYRQSSNRLWKLSDLSIDELNNRGIQSEYGEDYIEKYRLKQDPSILVFGEDIIPTAPQKVTNYFNGNCYLLIGPKTYSSANMLADAVSTFKLFSIIGMPTGERTNDFGEQKTEYLPHTNFPFDFTIAFDIGSNGDRTSKKTVEPDFKVEGDALKYAIDLILKQRTKK